MLHQKTITGVLWSFAQQLSTRGIGVFVTLLLAQFLEPKDFGLVAMMAIFIAVANSLMESGFKDALIQKNNVTQCDFSTAFYSNLIIGMLAYILLYIAAPIIANFYEEVRLISLVRVVGLVIMINSFQVVQIAILSCSLDFKAHVKASLPASIISGITAVTLAYFGFGVWALVVQMILAALLTTLFLWSMRMWRPTLEFNFKSAGELFNFGYKLFLSGLLDTVFRNLYVVAIAKLFSATIAGYYFFADKIKELILSQLVSAIQTVTYPALATMQDDNIRLKAGYRKVIKITTIILFPAMLFIASLAEPLYRVLLPDNWLPSVSYLQLMCIAGLMYPLHAINLNILKVKGRSDLFLYLEIIKKFFIVLILSVSLQFGVFGILIGQIVSSVLAYIPNSYYSAKLINYSVSEQVKDFLPGLILSVFAAGVTYTAIEYSTQTPLIELAVFGTLASLIYLGLGYLLKLSAFKLMEEIVIERLRK